MEEQREESASLGDCKAPLEETGKELGLASKSETLDGEIDVPVKDPCVEDDKAVEVSCSGVGSVTKDDVEKGVGSDDVVKTDADVKPVSVESHEGAGEEGNEVNDEEANCVVEGNGGGDSDAGQNVETEKPQQSSAVAEDKADDEQEAAAAKKSDEDVDSKQANEEENVGSETNNGKHSESVRVPEESTQEPNVENPAAETRGEEETTHKEENGEAMDIDYTEEETLEKAVLDDAGTSVVPTQDVPIPEADSNPSNIEVKEMETDETTDSAKPNSSTEDAAAAPGEVVPLDPNGLFDPRSDITNFIDFSGESWSGNIQDLKTESGNVSLKEDKKATPTAEEVASEEACNKSVGATANAESGDNAEGVENASTEAHVATDQQDTRREEGDTTHEAPNIDQKQQEDTVMEENPDNSDSDIKTNGVKRKADVLSEDDSLGEGSRKTVSLAKVSFAQRPSFKIGDCIARAASQMAGSPSVLKGSNLGDETLSVESFVSQLHSAATDPVKENVVSEIASGFFLDFRNSSASQQYVPEKTSSKRGRPSNSNAAGGTEAFEFEEMGDTYWTDRVIHNGGEEQTPAATEKESYQVVPVELKPAQVKRTRRPYRRRQSQIIYPLPSASDKPADFDENAPAELIMYFSEADAIPSEKNLSKMFRHFGPIRDSQTEIDEEKNRARVVFRKGGDADVAYKSAAKFNIFGTKTVNYELSFKITESFKVQPYVVSLGEEEAAASLPS